MQHASPIDEKHRELLRRIHEAFPDLQWSQDRYVGEGWDHEVIVLDEKIIFRFPEDEHYRALLAGEIDILNRLQPLVEVSVPQYTFVAPDGSFAGYSMIPGATVYREYFDKMSPADRSSLARQIADFLSTLHATRGFEPDLPAAYMAEDQAEVWRLAKQHLPSVLSTQDFAAAEKMLADIDVIIAQKHPVVFIHGDIYHNHLLWNEATKKLGIIDFGDRNLGDPAIDFAELHEYGEAFVREVYEHYIGPKDNALIDRSWAYQCWTGIYMMTDYFVNQNISFEESRELFDWTKRGKRP